MEILIVGVLLGLIPAMIARNKGRQFVVWWLYGAALFIVALPHALLLKPELKQLEEQQVAQGLKKCPFCGVVRLYDESGAKLIEKPVSARLRPNDEETQLDPRLLLERLLNRAVAEFVREVVTDPDLTRRVVAER